MSTGWSNGKLGLVLFIASEAMLFGALLASYLYNRAWNVQWPPAGDVAHRVDAFPLAFVLTIFLLTSGVACHYAVAAIRRGNQAALLGWLSVTIALGAFFMAGQVVEYAILFREGVTPWSGLYGTTFFSLTGMHGLHVLVGLAVLIGVYFRALSGHFSARRHFAVEGAALYWHFVDAVWAGLYILVYMF